MAACVDSYAGPGQAVYIIFNLHLEKLHLLQPAPITISWVPRLDCTIGIAHDGSLTFWNADTSTDAQHLVHTVTHLRKTSLITRSAGDMRCSLAGTACMLSKEILSISTPTSHEVLWLERAVWRLSDWSWTGRHILCISDGSLQGPACGQQYALGFVLIQAHPGLAIIGDFMRSSTEPEFSPCGIYLVYACRGSELIVADMKLQEVYHNDLSMLPGSPIRCSFSASGEQVWVFASNDAFAPADASAHVTKVLIVSFSRGWQGLDVHNSLHACLTATAVTL